MRQLTAGVVGCGINSEKHLRAFSWLPNVRVVAVYDVDKSRAIEKAGKFGIREIPRDFDSMLALGLDLVDIVTPTQTHCELTVRALEDGHNVLVEKPMAVTSKQCLKMMRSARKSGRSICLMHNKRFYDSAELTKATIGKERLTTTRMSTLHLYPHAQQGGTPRWI